MNFFERCGKLFFQQMRPPFFFALLLFPLLSASFFLFQKKGELQHLQERFSAAASKEKIALERKNRKEQFFARHAMPNPYFLDQQIESLPLLQKEQKKIESLLNHPAFPESSALKNRLAFLTENRLRFSEERIEENGEIKEIDEKQRFAVQMDERDLKQILALIENVQIEPYAPLPHSPQLIIKHFRLNKIQTPLQTDVFEVEMDLLKRELIQP